MDRAALGELTIDDVLDRQPRRQPEDFVEPAVPVRCEVLSDDQGSRQVFRKLSDLGAQRLQTACGGTDRDQGIGIG